MFLYVKFKNLDFISRVLYSYRGFDGLKSDIILFEVLKVFLGIMYYFCLKADKSGGRKFSQEVILRFK